MLVRMDCGVDGIGVGATGNIGNFSGLIIATASIAVSTLIFIKCKYCSKPLTQRQSQVQSKQKQISAIKHDATGKSISTAQPVTPEASTTKRHSKQALGKQRCTSVFEQAKTAEVFEQNKASTKEWGAEIEHNGMTFAISERIWKNLLTTDKDRQALQKYIENNVLKIGQCVEVTLNNKNFTLSGKKIKNGGAVLINITEEKASLPERTISPSQKSGNVETSNIVETRNIEIENEGEALNKLSPLVACALGIDGKIASKRLEDIFNNIKSWVGIKPLHGQTNLYEVKINRRCRVYFSISGGKVIINTKTIEHTLTKK